MIRRVVYAPSFDQGVEDIGVYIEETFGEQARQSFISKLADTSTRQTQTPFRQLGYILFLATGEYQYHCVRSHLCAILFP
jgi:hypothetical protein